MSRPARELHVAEPPASYLQRRPLVVDCSVICGLLFQEHWQAQAVQKISDRALHAPYLLHAELANVAVKKHKQGLAQIADDGIAQFQVMDMDLHPIKAQEVVLLALRYQLTAYDAAYLWLAAELKAPLATFDEKLGTAAKTHLATLN
jgi:predicted nucleic acid-binding protein